MSGENIARDLLTHPLPGIPRARTLIGALFFLSGLSALIYEVLWVRMLTLVFGNTAQAAAAVLAALFAGFAIGAFVGGRLADLAVHRLAPNERPSASPESPDDPWYGPLLLQLYALLELGIGLYALATPFVFKLGEVIFVALCRGTEESGPGLTALRIILSFALLVIPSALMGATLPALSKCVSEAIEKAGIRVGMLYSLNTWGGVAGSFAAGFLLIPFWGVTCTLIAAALINGFVAAAAFAISKNLAWPSPVAASPPLSSIALAKEDRPLVPPPYSLRLEESISHEGPRGWLLAIVAVSGFTSLAYEVLWTRTFIVIFGADIYAFTAVLTTFLAGIALGSYFAARALESQEKKHPARSAPLGTGILAIAILQIAIGIVTLALLPSFDKLPYVLFKTRHWLAATWLCTTILRFALTFLLMILPTALLGATFPLAARLYPSSLRRLGTEVGELYASNTVAAIAGSLASGFVLMPWLGVEWSIKLAAACNLALGGLLLVAPLALGARILVRIALIGLALLIAAVPGWDRNMIALSQLRVWAQSANSFAQFKALLDGMEMPFYEEGVCATVAVAGKGNLLSLTINGKPVASSGYSDLMIQRALGLLPTALSKQPKRALVIGMGTGVTLSGVPTRPGLKVDCVEISPEVVEAAGRCFAGLNHNVLQNPDVRVIVNDARQFLLLTDAQYDIITSDPIHPWTAGSVNLYTKEYYQLCRRHLRPAGPEQGRGASPEQGRRGGIMCQWLPMYQISDADMKAVLKTFSDAFPYTTVWTCASDLALIGMDNPLQIDLADFEEFFSREPIASDLAAVNLTSPFDVLAMLVLDEEGVARLTEGSALVTDDRPSLEFTTPRYYHTQIHCAILEEMLKYRPVAVERLVGTLRTGTGASARDAQRRLRYVFARSDKRLSLRASRVGQNFLVGFTNLWMGQVPEAIGMFESALPKNPNDPELRYYLGVAYTSAGDFQKARQQFLEALKLDPNMDEAHIELAKFAIAQGRNDEAFSYAKKALALNPWAAAPHDVLGIVYIRQKLLVKAEEEFLLALAANPRDPAARQGLLLLKSAATQLRQQQPPPPQQKPSAPKAEKAPPKTK